MTAPAKAAPMREDVTLADAPVGLFWCGETLALKTEYGNNEGRIDAYIVSSGEFFWGHAPQSIASQRATLVAPIPDDVARHRFAHTARSDEQYDRDLALAIVEGVLLDRPGKEDIDRATAIVARHRLAYTARPDAGDDKAEIERLRGLLIDPGTPPWEDARAVLATEMRKIGRPSMADHIAEGGAADVPSHIALNLIAQAARRPDAGDEDVERVARAICAANHEDPDEPQHGALANNEPLWKLYEDDARAALAAMREGVDRGMVDAATALFPEGTMYRSGHDGTGPDPSLFFCEAVGPAPDCHRVRVVADTEAHARSQAAAALDTEQPR